MALDLEEQEQLAELKAWWKANGTRVIAGLTVFLVAVAGWRGWQAWSQKQAAEASLLFERAVQAAMMNDVKAVKDLSGQIMEHYGRSGYAAPAAWLSGRLNHDAGDLKSATAQYEYALEHARGKGAEQLARLRLAVVRLDAKDYPAALRLLEEPHDTAFAGLYAHLKGDVLAAQGRVQEARAAYRLAVERLGQKSPLKPLVEIKLDGLGG